MTERTQQAATELMAVQHGPIDRPLPVLPSQPSQPLLRMQHIPSENNNMVPVPVGCITLAPPEPCAHPPNSSQDCDRCGFKSSHQRHNPNTDHIIVGRCPHCSKKYKMRVNELVPPSSSGGADVYGGEGAGSSGRGVDFGSTTTMDSAAALNTMFAELGETLRRHGNALQKIELCGVQAPPPLRIGGRELPTPPTEKPGDSYYPAGKGRESLGPATYQMMMEYSDDMDSGSEHGSDDCQVVGIHPLVYDIEDVKMLTAGVSRLLKTLHDKVSLVEKQDNALRAEKQEIRRVMARNQRVAEDLEQQRMEVEKMKMRLQRERAILKAEQRRLGPMMMQQSQDMPFGAGMYYDALKSREEFTRIPTPPSSSSGDSGKTVKRKVSYSALAYTPIVAPGGKLLWSPEKEDQLRTLQAKLRDANDNWSPEAEEYYERVEELLDERYKAKKLARFMKTDKPELSRKDSKTSMRAATPTMRPITPVKPTPLPSAMKPMPPSAMKQTPAGPPRRRNTTPAEEMLSSEDTKKLRKLFGGRKE